MSAAGDTVGVDATNAVARPGVRPAGAPSGLTAVRDRIGRRATATALQVAARCPPAFQVLVVYGLTRGATALLVQHGIGPDAGAGYLARMEHWDGAWYRSIAENGYPPTLPVDADGRVAQNAWAFFPMFPITVRLLSGATGADFALSALLLNLFCGAVAVLLVRSVIAHALGDRAAFWAVTFLCCAPASPVLQLAYAESVALLLVAAVLRALQVGRADLAACLVAVAGLARPVGIPLAVVAGVHAVRLWRNRAGDRRTATTAAVLAGAGAVAAAGWPCLVALRTGAADGFLATQAAWREQAWTSPGGVWLPAGRGLLGDAAGTVLVVAVPCLLAWWLSGPCARRLGPDLLTWTVAYLVYLWPATAFASTLPRFLLLAFPLFALLVPRRPDRCSGPIVTVVALLCGQVLWLAAVWPHAPPYFVGPP